MANSKFLRNNKTQHKVKNSKSKKMDKDINIDFINKNKHNKRYQINIEDVKNIKKDDLIFAVILQSRSIGYEDYLLFMAQLIGEEKMLKEYVKEIKKYSKDDLLEIYKELNDLENS